MSETVRVLTQHFFFCGNKVVSLPASAKSRLLVSELIFLQDFGFSFSVLKKTLFVVNPGYRGGEEIEYSHVD